MTPTTPTTPTTPATPSADNDLPEDKPTLDPKLLARLDELDRYIQPAAELPEKATQQAAGARQTEPLPFCLDGVAPCVLEAHRATALWARDIIKHRQPLRWLTIYGASGCGKTHLSKLARYAIRQAGIECQMHNWPRCLVRILSGEYGLIGHLCRLPVLILDDLGAEYIESDRSAALDASKLYEILDGRLTKWTLISSNLSPEHIGDRLDVRIRSRLYRGHNEIIDMSSAEDYGYKQFKTRACHANQST